MQSTIFCFLQIERGEAPWQIAISMLDLPGSKKDCFSTEETGHLCVYVRCVTACAGVYGRLDDVPLK